jgi:hypothetical protein
MRENSGVYEYIAVYVDDIAVAAHDPEHIMCQLKETHKYKLKGVGPLDYHLGCMFKRDIRMVPCTITPRSTSLV